MNEDCCRFISTYLGSAVTCENCPVNQVCPYEQMDDVFLKFADTLEKVRASRQVEIEGVITARQCPHLDTVLCKSGECRTCVIYLHREG